MSLTSADKDESADREVSTDTDESADREVSVDREVSADREASVYRGITEASVRFWGSTQFGPRPPHHKWCWKVRVLARKWHILYFIYYNTIRLQVSHYTLGSDIHLNILSQLYYTVKNVRNTAVFGSTWIYLSKTRYQTLPMFLQWCNWPHSKCQMALGSTTSISYMRISGECDIFFTPFHFYILKYLSSSSRIISFFSPWVYMNKLDFQKKLSFLLEQQ